MASVDSSSEFHNKHGEEHTMLRGHDMISLMNFGKSKNRIIYIYIFIYECVSDNGAYSPNVHCDRDIDH